MNGSGATVITKARSERRAVAATAFARVLRAARHKAGLSQEELAFRAGLDRTYPSLLERGLRQPTVAVAFVLAEALNLGPAELVICTAIEMRRPS